MHKNSEVVRELTLKLEVKEQIKRKEKNNINDMKDGLKRWIPIKKGVTSWCTQGWFEEERFYKVESKEYVHIHMYIDISI